ncbi:MAG: carboxypeptidase regulatory-like domain-containing protein [Burkholderiaceae bacterium]
MVALAGCAMLAGCIPYPVYKTLQPSARVRVLDAAGRPLSGAQVVLVASAFPYGGERHRSSARTGVDGRTTFEAEREWRVEWLVLHGAETYFWNWCVHKQGYQTFATHLRSAKLFQDTLEVRLQEGAAVPCRPPPATASMPEDAPAVEPAR